jgi:hypothetical protein
MYYILPRFAKYFSNAWFSNLIPRLRLIDVMILSCRERYIVRSEYVESSNFP